MPESNTLSNKKLARAGRSPGVCIDRNGLMACRVCGCTEANACFPPCGWSDSDVRGDLCTNCADAVEAIMTWLQGAVSPSRAALSREVDRQLEARAKAATF